MNKILHTLAVAAVALVAAAAANAQDEPTVTLKWISSEGMTTTVRSGSALNGKVYFVDGKNINTYDSKTGTVETYITIDCTALNKGLYLDDAGNILINPNFGYSGLKAENWN